MPLQGDDFMEFLKRAEKAFKNMPTRVANLAVNEFKDNFDRQGFFDKSWEKRANNYRAGEPNILIGVGKATLKESIDSVVDADNLAITVFVGDEAADYGKIHNEGGTITMQITEKMRRFFWAKHKSAKTESEKNMWKACALKKGSMTIKIPQRQFIGEHPMLVKKIDELIENTLKNLQK